MTNTRPLSMTGFFMTIMAIMTITCQSFGASLSGVDGHIFLASWYSEASLIKEGTRKNGERQVMANGKEFDETKFTCASRDYDLRERLKISAVDSGRSVVCEVTDRIGKRFKGKRIDLSKRAFEVLAGGRLDRGILQVQVKPI